MNSLDDGSGACLESEGRGVAEGRGRVFMTGVWGIR
jgi:hypothetical protein